MMKYIDADKLTTIIEERKAQQDQWINRYHDPINQGISQELAEILSIITSLQQEQPNGKQVIIITETDGDANIHWDCRSLEDVRALLVSAESYISDKQNEELRVCGSGPDYNTEEGRYNSLFKHRQEQLEADLEKEIMRYQREDMDRDTTVRDVARHFAEWGVIHLQPEVDLEKEIARFALNGGTGDNTPTIGETARHFYNLGLNARKEK